ncbi:hypothetical protein U1Q18_005670 [Sarracenia purpurea var. burkii]
MNLMRSRKRRRKKTVSGGLREVETSGGEAATHGVAPAAAMVFPPQATVQPSFRFPLTVKLQASEIAGAISEERTTATLVWLPIGGAVTGATPGVHRRRGFRRCIRCREGITSYRSCRGAA